MTTPALKTYAEKRLVKLRKKLDELEREWDGYTEGELLQRLDYVIVCLRARNSTRYAIKRWEKILEQP